MSVNCRRRRRYSSTRSIRNILERYDYCGVHPKVFGGGEQRRKAMKEKKNSVLGRNDFFFLDISISLKCIAKYIIYIERMSNTYFHNLHIDRRSEFRAVRENGNIEQNKGTQRTEHIGAFHEKPSRVLVQNDQRGVEPDQSR